MVIRPLFLQALQASFQVIKYSEMHSLAAHFPPKYVENCEVFFPPNPESQKATSTGIYVSELVMLCTARKYDPNPASSIRRALRTSSFQWKMTLSYFCIRRTINAHFQLASWMDISPQNVGLHQQSQVWVDGRELRSPVRVCHLSCSGLRVISGIISCEQDLKSGIFIRKKGFRP